MKGFGWRVEGQSLANGQAANPSLVPFAAVSAAYFAHIGFFNPYLPLWLKHLGQPLWAIAVLVSVQSITRVFMPYVWGWLGDRTGRPVLCMRIGAVLALVGCMALWGYSLMGVPTLVGLYLGLLALFMPTSAIIPTSESLMTQRLNQSGKGFDAIRYGRLRMWGSIGFLVTVLGAGVSFETLGMGWFMPIAALTLGLVLLSVLSLPNSDEKRVLPADSLDSMLLFLKQPQVMWLLASVFFHVLAHMGLYLFLSLWLDANGYSKAAIGALWAMGVAVEVMVLYGQGRWLSRLSWPAWLMVCAALCGLRMGAIAVGVASVAVLVVAQALHGLTFATHHTAVVALIAQMFPDPMKGRAQALYAVIGYGLTGVLGATVGAVVGEQWGLGMVFGLCAFASVLALACAWRLHIRLA